jgi:transposase
VLFKSDQAQGRRQPEKLQTEIIEFILSERYKKDEKNSGYRIAEKILDRFHVNIHPRTVYKVLKKMI